jgi:hypothetical protein
MFYDDTNSMFWSDPHREQVSPNTGDVQLIFQVATTSILTWLDPQASIVPSYANNIFTWAENLLYVAMHCLFAVMWCSDRTAYPFILKSHAIHTYCRKCWTSGIVQWRCTHAMLLLIYSLSAFSFWHFFFRWPTLPHWTQMQFSLFSLVEFFEPPGLLDVVVITTDWDFVVDACATNALDFAAVIEVCNRFFDRTQFLVQVVCRLLVIRRLPDVVTQAPPMLGSAHAAIKSVCRATLFHAALFMSLNNFSTLATHVAMSISGSRCSFKTPPSSTE